MMTDENDKYIAEQLTIEHLKLAYAITTHKIQGSGRRFVVLDCDTQITHIVFRAGNQYLHGDH